MTFDRYFRRTKERLLRDLDAFLSAKRKDVALIKPWGRDVLRRLGTFTRKGKMIRGGLVSLGFEMAGGKAAAAAIRAGTAFELIQSGLLIHDDIMDRDARRRGAASIHEQYALLAEEGPGGPGAAHFGTSMAICAGEIAIFLAFEALAGLRGPAKRTAAVQRIFAAEFGLVGLGQMRDIQAGTSRSLLSDGDILDIYRYKTARYSFSLPLAAGWILGGGRGAVLPALQRLGEDLGLVFQIKDDELGLFGKAGTTGKPVGSDIRQGKKTLYSLRLLERADGPEKDRLEAVLGQPGATDADILFVRELAERLGVREDVRKVMERLGRRARGGIRSLPIGKKHAEILQSLLEYSFSRKR